MERFFTLQSGFTTEALEGRVCAVTGLVCLKSYILKPWRCLGGSDPGRYGAVIGLGIWDKT